MRSSILYQSVGLQQNVSYLRDRFSFAQTICKRSGAQHILFGCRINLFHAIHDISRSEHLPYLFEFIWCLRRSAE